MMKGTNAASCHRPWKLGRMSRGPLCVEGLGRRWGGTFGLLMYRVTRRERVLDCTPDIRKLRNIGRNRIVCMYS